MFANDSAMENHSSERKIEICPDTSKPMNGADIIQTLEDLSKTRPVFHNEANFQFSLAWEIQKQNPETEIRLEHKVPEFDNRYIDICVLGPNPTFIELKYKTVRTILTTNEENFVLVEHGAQPLGRYDFLKDLQRIEETTSPHPGTTGYAILLTNDHRYWSAPSKHDSIDKAFKIDEGREIHGTLSWSSAAGGGTTKNREEPLQIMGRYDCRWSDFSDIDPASGKFRYLCLRVA